NIKYRVDKNRLEATIEKEKKTNEELDKEYIIDNNNIYWKRNFSKYIKQYLK
ncbi:16582_t:CDS:1, partial [Racocetra persica]